MENVPLDKLELHPDIQSRVEIDLETVQDYAEDIEAGVCFPPVQVIKEDGHYWVWDGFHRVIAARRAAKPTLAAYVKSGAFQTAQWLASGANIAHGLRRSNADKRRAVEMALGANSTLSDRLVAQHCGVSPTTVGTIRAELTVQSGQSTQRTGADGRTINTSNIGKSQEPHEWPEPVPVPATSPVPQAEDASPPNCSYEARPGSSILHRVEPQPDPDEIPGEYEYENEEEPEPAPEEKRQARPTFNLTNDNIQWAAWSWNPVTGCRHGCPYCYARDIANRFYPEKFEPTYRPERLAAPLNTPQIGPRWQGDQGYNGVFVCSMADLFGEWVPQDWIDAILTVVKDSPQWNFIFLTKNPARLATIEWPDNAWVGATVDTLSRVKPTQEAFANVRAPVRFVSVEPMREPVLFTDYSLFDWIIIGGQSQSSVEPARQPEYWWVHELTDQAHLAGCKVFWKPNLTVTPQEYPAANSAGKE